MPKKIALLDVDETLTFDTDPTHINEKQVHSKLLNYLQEKKITDVYLFTDMVLTSEVVAHRLALKTLLEQNGFNVLAVVTPSDLLWSCLDVDNAMPSFLGFDTERLRDFLKQNYTVSYPGIAFEEFVQSEQEEQKTYCSRVSHRLSRIIIPQLLPKLDYLHKKGLMLEFMSHHLPPKIKEILIVDDKEKVLASARQMRARWPQEKTHRPLIDMIHVRKKGAFCHYKEKHQVPRTINLSAFKQRKDTEKIFNKINALREVGDLNAYRKASLIEDNLREALAEGCNKVNHDPGVRKALKLKFFKPEVQQQQVVSELQSMPGL